MFNTAQLNRIEKKLDVLLQKTYVPRPFKIAIPVAARASTVSAVLPSPGKKRGRPFKNACDQCSFKGKNKQSVAQHKRHNHK